MSLIIKLFEKYLNIYDAKITFFLNEYRIFVLDKTINSISNLATPMLISAIAILYLFYKKSKQKIYLEITKHMIFSFAVCATLTFVFKNTIQRQRPFKVNTEITKLGSGGSYSYPSGHTADSMVLYFILPLAFTKNNKVKIICAFWAIFISYSRLYLGVHYITDILGAVLLAKISVELYPLFSTTFGTLK